jgi:hypothetical protein
MVACERKDVDVAYLKVLLQHLPGITKETQENP